MGLTILTLVSIGYVVPNILINIFGFTHKNSLIDLILKVVTCQKCFTTWFTLFYLIIIGPFSIPILFITIMIGMLLDKINNII